MGNRWLARETQSGRVSTISDARFVFVGYYGKQNLGDEAILTSFLYELERGGYQRWQVRVITADEADTRKRHDVTPVRRDSPVAVIGYVVRSHHVVLSGGGWHFDRPIAAFYALFLVLLGRLFGRTVSICCIGVEPITRPLSKLIVRTILHASDWVSVRDQESADELLRVCASARVTVAADPVFAGALRVPTGMRTCWRRNPRPIIAISILDARGAKKYAAIREDYPRIVDGIVERLDAEVFLVATSPGEGDIEVSRYVQARCTHSDRVHIQETAKDLGDVMAVVASSDLVVGMRYHVLIAAALAGVPFAAIVRSPKVMSICRALGQPVLGSIGCYNVDDVIDGVCEAFGKRESLRRNLAEGVPVVVRRYESSMEVWMAVLEGRGPQTRVGGCHGSGLRLWR